MDYQAFELEIYGHSPLMNSYNLISQVAMLCLGLFLLGTRSVYVLSIDTNIFLSPTAKVGLVRQIISKYLMSYAGKSKLSFVQWY